MNTKILSELGLSDREIAVYVALHKLGSTTTGPLVKESGVQNAKVYETLNKLKIKGLATYILKEKTKYFQATDPNTLLNFFEEKKESTKKMIEQLKTLREKREPEYEARIYEGIKAIKSVFYELYDYIGENSEYCVFPIGESLSRPELINFFNEIFHKRTKMRIKIRALPNKKIKKTISKFYSHHQLLSVKYTTQEFPTGIFIFKDHVLNVTWSEKPVATLIKSRENAQRWQKFFNKEWNKEIRKNKIKILNSYLPQ